MPGVPGGLGGVDRLEESPPSRSSFSLLGTSLAKRWRFQPVSSLSLYTGARRKPVRPTEDVLRTCSCFMGACGVLIVLSAVASEKLN